MLLQALSSHNTSEVSEFFNFLLREGIEPEDDIEMIQIDSRYIIPSNSIAYFVISVYGNIYEYYTQYINQKSILRPKNETADLTNNTC